MILTLGILGSWNVLGGVGLVASEMVSATTILVKLMDCSVVSAVVLLIRMTGVVLRSVLTAPLACPNLSVVAIVW